MMGSVELTTMILLKVKLLRHLSPYPIPPVQRFIDISELLLTLALNCSYIWSLALAHLQVYLFTVNEVHVHEHKRVCW